MVKRMGSDPEFALRAKHDGEFYPAYNWFERYREVPAEREPTDEFCWECDRRCPVDRRCYNNPCDECYPFVLDEDGEETGERDFENGWAECPFHDRETECDHYEPRDNECVDYPCSSCYADDDYYDEDLTSAEWGTDGCSHVAEMRPQPGASWEESSDNLCRLVENVLEELRYTGHKLWAGAYVADNPIGGHIHFSGTDYDHETLGKLDKYLSHPLNNLCGSQADRRLNTSYGRDSAYEEKSNRNKWFEYRTPPSWVISREVVDAVYCLGWALVHDAFPTSPDTFQVWREIAQEYKCPALAKLAGYAESGLTFPACDVGELWSVPIEEWADKPKLDPRGTVASDNSGITYSGYMLHEICHGMECSCPLTVFGWGGTRGTGYITLYGFDDEQIDAVRSYLRFNPEIRVEVGRPGTGDYSIGMAWDLRNDHAALMRGVVSLCADLLSNS